ncbi:hypothetical protein GC167_04155 [bacterium]|nr:hypothetical protein [bacterium]
MLNRLPFWLLALGLFWVQSTRAQPDPEHRVGVEAFVRAMGTRNPELIANFIVFPLSRPEPLPSIESREDFIRRFYQVFDGDFLVAIAQSNLEKDWATVGWRGTAFRDGELWLDENGKLRALNRTSKAEQAEIEARNATIQNGLHPSVATFQRSITAFSTRSFRVRIDELVHGRIRYAAWKLPNPTSSEPSLVLENGVLEAQGSGGNHSYFFYNQGYVYEAHFIVLGTDDDPLLYCGCIKASDC